MNATQESGIVRELGRDTFEDAINGHPLAVIDFWAPWCRPCRAFAPVFAAAAAKHTDILFGKVNTEDERELAAHFGIRSIPTLMIFRDNIIVYAEPGALPAGAFEEVLKAARSLDMEKVRRDVEAADEAPSNADAQPTG